MSKKLILIICIFVLLISIPIANAEDEKEINWWDSLVKWLSELLGITPEEAQKVIETTPYSQIIEMGTNKETGNKIYSGEFSPAPIYIPEDGKWVRVEEAKSLMNKKWTNEKGKEITLYSMDVQSDGINLVEVADFNYTTATVKLKRDSALLSNVPLRKFTADEKGNRTYDSSFTKNLNFNDNKEQKQLVIPMSLDETLEFGEHSSELNLTANLSEGFADTNWDPTAPNDNFQTDTYLSCNPSKIGGLMLNTSHFLGTSPITILSGSIDIYSPAGPACTALLNGIHEIWNWESSTYNDANATDDNPSFLGGARMLGASLGTLVANPGGYVTYPLTNATELDYMHDTMGIINIRLDPGGGADNVIGFYANSGSNIWAINITWEVPNTAPTDPIPLLNSTTSDQMNYTNETLACNFLCYDSDVADTLNYNIYWLKNSISQFSYNSQSCANPSYNSPILASGNMSSGDIWSCSINITDNSGSSSNTVLSNDLLAREYYVNYPPENMTIYPPSPENLTRTNNNSITYNYNASDPDDNQIYFECYQDANNPPTTLISNETGAATVTVEDGNWWWRCRATDNYSESSSYSDTRFLSVDNSTITNITYSTPDPIYETTENELGATVDINDLTVQSVSATLTYNGINYIPEKTTNSDIEFTFTKTISAPHDKNTVEFEWNFTATLLNGSTDLITYNSTQTLDLINFRLCDSETDLAAVNFTFYNEITKIELNISKLGAENSTNVTFKSTVEFWEGNRTSSAEHKTYYVDNSSMNASQFQLCIYPQYEIITTTMDIDYDVQGYTDRKYYLTNASLSNQTNEVSLYLLPEDLAYKFYITVKKNLLPVDYAYVIVTKYDTGIGGYLTIGIRKTDINGQFIEYLDLDKEYKFYVIKDIMYEPIVKSSICSAAPCEMTLNIEEVSKNIWSGYDEIFASGTSTSLTYNDTTGIITYDFVDLTGLANYFHLKVNEVRYNESSGTVCDSYKYATAGQLTCDLSGYDKGDFVATGYVSRSLEKITDSINLARSVIKAILGPMGLLVAFFLIVTIGLVFVWNPSAGVVGIAFSVLALKLMEIVAFSYTTVTLVFVIAIIMAYLMKT